MIIYTKPYQSAHFSAYYWAFADGFVQGKPNIDEYFWIRSSVEVRNDTESEWIIVEGSRSRNKAWFSKLLQPFPSTFQIYIMIICSLLLLIHFFCYFGKGRRFLPPGAYTRFSPLLFMFLWILFLTKSDKIMSLVIFDTTCAPPFIFVGQ